MIVAAAAVKSERRCWEPIGDVGYGALKKSKGDREMAEERVKLIEKVITRLNDLRSSLEFDERNILDEIVVGRTAEVEGHAWDPGLEVHGRIDWENESYSFQPRLDPKSQPRLDPKSQPKHDM
jgi:hypothetical protein